MSRTRSRTRLAALATSALLATVIAGTVPVAAADTPETAVDALLDAVAAGDLTELDAFVCAEAQADVRTAFEPADTGLAEMDALFSSVSIQIVDRAIEITEQDQDSATATVQATLTMDVDTTAMETLVRDLIEASAGPDDPPLTDEDLALMMPFMVDALAADQGIDSQIRLVLEDGEWLVCSGFDGGLEEPDDLYEADPIVSTDGLCALASPAELSTLSSLGYDSSTGFNEYCNYTWSDRDEFHSASASVIFESTLDEWREAFPPDAELEAAGGPAFSSGQSLFSQAGDDVLQVSVSLPEAPPEDVDAITQAVRVSELLIPRLPDLVMVELPAEGPDPEAATGPTLCDGMSLEDLSFVSGRAFVSAKGSETQCTWETAGGEGSDDTIVAAISGLGLDDYREWMSEPEGMEIDTQPALVADNQLVVALPDGRTLDITVWYDTEADEPLLPAGMLAAVTAEHLLAAAPSTTTIPSGGLLHVDGWIEDACAVVPATDLSALSGIAFDDPGFGGDYCEYYGGDEESGWHYATSALDERPLEAWFEDFPEAFSVEVGGQPAALVKGIFPDMGDSAAVFVTLPGYGELTFGIGLGVDTSSGFETDTVRAVTEAAALALARLMGSD